MSRVKAQLAQLRNVLAEMHVVELYPGVQLATLRSNAADLADRGAGGLLELVFALSIDPDGKHPYFEDVHLDVNVDNELLTDFANVIRSVPAPARLHMRNTYPTPAFDVERAYDIDPAISVRDFVCRLIDTASAFVRSQYRPLVTALHAAGYFDSTDWACPVAVHFLEHLKVKTCPSEVL